LDTWRGWADERLGRVVDVLAMIELPERAPRAILAAPWARLRAAVPFDLRVPGAQDKAGPLSVISAPLVEYLTALGVQVDSWEASGDLPAGPVATLFRGELAAHGAQAHSFLLPLANSIYGSFFASQRSMSLQASALGVGSHDRAAPGESSEHDQRGRALRSVGKLRAHLVLWLLCELGLTRVEAALMVYCFEASALTTRLPSDPRDLPNWADRLAREVDESLAYWRNRRGAAVRTPRAYLDALEVELLELLRPRPAGYPGVVPHPTDPPKSEPT